MAQVDETLERLGVPMCVVSEERGVVEIAGGGAVRLVIGFMLAKLYRRSTRDEAYVRAGLGGQKVVLDGGSLVLPVFHSTAAVNLKTLRLEVTRGGPDSLITKDRMRVDIGAEFYVRVKPDMSSIALAAQTLGSRTNDAQELRELIDVSRPVAFLLVGILYFLTDEDGPFDIVAELRSVMAPGSYLAISHVVSDDSPDAITTAQEIYRSFLRREGDARRTRAQVRTFFDGLDLIEPGLVYVRDWRGDDSPDLSPVTWMVGGVVSGSPFVS